MYKRASFVSSICLLSGLVIASACGDDEPSAPGIAKPIEEPSTGDGDVSEPGDGDGEEPVGDGDGEEPGDGDGDGEEPVGDGDGEEPGDGDGDGDDAAVMRGQKLADANSCTSCHQGNYAGLAYFSNVTPDVATGIGGWTDAQIAAALKEGVNPEGGKLCNQMPKFTFSDSELADVIAFLRSLPAVSKKITSTCNF